MIAYDCADILYEAQFSDAYICFAKTRKSESSQEKYDKKIKKEEEKIKYEKSLLPESGYMTLEEYEEKSRAKTRKEITEEILDKPDMPKDKNYIYVPQHIFKLVRYNEPVGSPELQLPRRLFFDRQVNVQGIVSGDYRKLVYPSVYYYAEMDSVGCDLFLINLDETLDNLERVKRANVLNKEQMPILSTHKETKNKSIFRTLTPIDYSADSSKLLIKEKTGSRHDGIWKTDVWVYDFTANQSKNLTALREAIEYYWKKTENLELSDKRWDVYPMGFDANNDDRIIVCAYAFTGGIPKFLGTWSIDVNNEAAKLESVTSAGIPISVVGFKISKEHDIRSISELEFEAKQEHAILKAKSKEEAKQKKLEKKEKYQEYKNKLREIDGKPASAPHYYTLKFKNKQKDYTDIDETQNQNKEIPTQTDKEPTQPEYKPIQTDDSPVLRDESPAKTEEKPLLREEPIQTENRPIFEPVHENNKFEPEQEQYNNEKTLKEKYEERVNNINKQNMQINDATPTEHVKIELPDLNVILEKFKRDAGITPEQEAEDELYDLDELDNLEE